ncbi:hypothetical protein E3Q16_03227 [Wallemia mellicola]|uniref:MIF4G domain-containing protein n=1 Tax=Wallemia mellicola TaxID=1708541 RepID=A0AB74KAW2_9BASI|nr:hypothetical protein E3Q24_00483 [Wallemia mellicola]TIB89907.1 hypothetical protein E3Q21_00350 [Wallemia mellicola]TIB92436.1 hypothetical protein E3Q20_00332 [Wallemia mellicola]TIC03019.1 hypothetical protein E3Q16_03227 [Wallemia mellicola]TIC06365.1 hypothetical protein E3Q15_04438 [Wallemia mellicola]
MEGANRKQGSLDILHGRITKDNAIELIDNNDHLREENQTEENQNKSAELQQNALDMFNKKDLQLSEVLVATITSDIFNAINVTSEDAAAEIFEQLCRLFEPLENLPMLHSKFLNSKLEYGEDAYAFYFDLKELFKKLEKSGVTIGKQAQKAKAIQSLPDQLRQMKFQLSQETSKEVSFKDLVGCIIDRYKNYVTVFPPDSATSNNQNIRFLGLCTKLQ